jgi:hypothetical protein
MRVYCIASFLILIPGLIVVLIFIALVVFPRKFQRFGSDYFKFRAAFIADDYVAFFKIVLVEIESALTFRASRHSVLQVPDSTGGRGSLGFSTVEQAGEVLALLPPGREFRMSQVLILATLKSYRRGSKRVEKEFRAFLFQEWITAAW